MYLHCLSTLAPLDQLYHFNLIIKLLYHKLLTEIDHNSGQLSHQFINYHLSIKNYIGRMMHSLWVSPAAYFARVHSLNLNLHTKPCSRLPPHLSTFLFRSSSSRTPFSLLLQNYIRSFSFMLGCNSRYGPQLNIISASRSPTFEVGVSSPVAFAAFENIASCLYRDVCS